MRATPTAWSTDVSTVVATTLSGTVQFTASSVATFEENSNISCCNGSTSRLPKFSYRHGIVHTWLTVVVLTCFMLCCAIGNSFVVAAIRLERNLQSVSNYLIFSLALADLMVSLLVLPVSLINEISDKWWMGLLACDIFVCLDILCCTASILHLVAIAVDRYWAVTNVDYIRKRSARRILLMIAVVWTISITVSLPSRFHPERAMRYQIEFVEKGLCTINSNELYTIFSTLCAFYLPMFLLMGIYSRIYVTARKHIRKKHLHAKSSGSQQAPVTQRPLPVPQPSSVQPRRILLVNGGPRVIVADESDAITPIRNKLVPSTVFNVSAAEPSSIHPSSSGSSNASSTSSASNLYKASNGTPRFHFSENIAQLDDDAHQLRIHSQRGSWCGTDMMEPLPVANDVPHALTLSVLAEEGDLTAVCTFYCSSTVPLAVPLASHSQKTHQISVAASSDRTKVERKDDAVVVNKLTFLDSSSLTDSPRLYRPHSWFSPPPCVTPQLTTKTRIGLTKLFSRVTLRKSPSPAASPQAKSGSPNCRPVGSKVPPTHREHSQISIKSSVQQPDSPAGSLEKEEHAGQQQSRLLIKRPTIFHRRRSSVKLTSLRERLEHKREKKAARTLSIITGCFLVCWLPFFGNVLLSTFIGYEPAEWLMSVLLWLGYTNSLLNPVIYTVFSPDFRNAFRKIIMGKYACFRR